MEEDRGEGVSKSDPHSISVQSTQARCATSGGHFGVVFPLGMS